MENGSGGSGGGGADTPISIPGLPDFTVQVTDIACPVNATDLPREHFKKYFEDCYCTLRSFHVPGFVATFIAALTIAPAAAMLVSKDLVIIVMRLLLPTLGAEVLDGLDDLRKALDSEFAKLAVGVLNELLGTAIGVGDMPSSASYTDHLARADKLGGILHDTLLKEFGDAASITPDSGRAAARRFSGLMINFGTATGVLATLGGLVPAIHLDDIREIGEQVAGNLGLGRLGRQVLRPVVQILMEEPYKWWINERFRPTQFTALDVVNPYTAQTMDPKLVHDSLALQGYSDDKISALIQLHQKKISESDAFLLLEHDQGTEDDFLLRMKNLGYSLTDAEMQKHIMLIKEEVAIQTRIVDVAMASYRHGVITRDEFSAVVKQAISEPSLQALTMTLADFNSRLPHRSLIIGELTQMLTQNVITLDDFDTYLENLGYSPQDTDNLRILTLLNINAKEAAAKAKAAAAAAKTAAAAAKAAGSGSTTTTG